MSQNPSWKSINLKWIAEYHGPNTYAGSAVVVGEMTGGVFTDIARLRAACAALWAQAGMDRDPDHVSGPTGHDGLLTLGRAASDWARSALNDVRGFVLDAGAEREGEGVRLWVGFHDAELSRTTVQLALRSLVGLVNGQFDAAAFRSDIERLWQSCRKRHPDYQARIIMTAARQRGVPYAPAWGIPRYWRFGEGARSRVLFESSSSDDGHFGSRIQGDKVTSKTVLTQLGLPTPRFTVVNDEDKVAAAVEKVGFPLVAKPIDRGGGKGVSAGIISLDAAVAGFRQARAFSKSPILFEAHLEGEDHRLMVVDGKCVAAIRREPPQVVGDGQSTIRQLVDSINQVRDARSLVRSGYFRPISLDAGATLHLAGMGLSEGAVLEEGRSICVRSNANLSTGGHCVDVTAQIHPHIRTMAETLAQALNLRMMGADYLTTDISCDPQELSGGFVEFNTTPGLDALLAAGWSEEQAGALCLPNRVGPLPKVLLVMESLTEQAYLVAVRECRWPAGTGWASHGHAALSGAPLVVPDGHPWAGPGVLLGQATLRSAVVLACGEDIETHGAPAGHFERIQIVGDISTALRKLLMSISRRVDDLSQDVAPGQAIQSALQHLMSASDRENEERQIG